MGNFELVPCHLLGSIAVSLLSKILQFKRKIWHSQKGMSGNIGTYMAYISCNAPPIYGICLYFSEEHDVTEVDLSTVKSPSFHNSEVQQHL